MTQHETTLKPVAGGIAQITNLNLCDIAIERAIARSATVFQTPVSSAVVATVPLVPWIYPQAPRLMLGVLVGLMFIPVILVLRRLILKPLLPLLYSLGVFYLLGLIVSIYQGITRYYTSIAVLVWRCRPPWRGTVVAACRAISS